MLTEIFYMSHMLRLIGSRLGFICLDANINMHMNMIMQQCMGALVMI